MRSKKYTVWGFEFYSLDEAGDHAGTVRKTHVLNADNSSEEMTWVDSEGRFGGKTMAKTEDEGAQKVRKRAMKLTRPTESDQINVNGKVYSYKDWYAQWGKDK